MSMEPGPELDAALAEAMGKRVCRDEKCDGEECVAPGGYLVYSGETQTWDGTTPYSTDIAKAVAAAEEMREKGKIRAWDLRSEDEGFEAAIWPHPWGKFYVSVGSYPAHALALALKAALEAQ